MDHAELTRTKAVTNASKNCIKEFEVLDHEEDGTEVAVWNMKVEDFPAFIVVDDKEKISSKSGLLVE